MLNSMNYRILARTTLIAVAMFSVTSQLTATDFPLADRVVIDKSDRELYLLKNGDIFRTFKIALGIRPVGDKHHEGDFKTPEGTYRLDQRNPDSDFFLSIHVSYPNASDRREANAVGADPGGAIMLHGQPNEPTHSEAYYRTRDWTNGCVALSNSDMIDVWLMTGKNTVIEIRP